MTPTQTELWTTPIYRRSCATGLRILADQVAAASGRSGGVMAWMQPRGIAQARVDIIQQDEFSYDFLIPLATGRTLGGFGVT